MGKQGARILPLAAEDVERLAMLAREIWHAHYPAIITIPQIEYMLSQRYAHDLIRDELRREGLWWSKLMVGGEMAGFASYLLDGAAGDMKIDKLYVHPRHQRQGHGGRLIGHIGTVARQRGCGRLTLAVNKGNRSAIAAYLKHGFHIAESVVKDIGGGFVMDDYIMVRPVTRDP